MNSPFPWDGGCRCGQIRISVSAAPIMTMACHCTGCQRMSAGAYSLSAMFPSAAFRVTKGEPVIGGLHGEARHFFCAHCKSWVFTRPPRPAGDQFVNVRPTMFDDLAWFVPFIETYTSEKLPWVGVPAQHSFEKFPTMADFPRLLAAYAEQESKPS